MPVALGHALWDCALGNALWDCAGCPNSPSPMGPGRQGRNYEESVKQVVFLYQQKKVDFMTVSHQYQRL